MPWSRREFLRVVGVAGAGAPMLARVGSGGEAGPPQVFLISATDDTAGGHHVMGYSLHGARGAGFDLRVPVRCHAAALHPKEPHVALVARRPGTAIYIVDVRRGTLIRTIVAPPERHYFGHAVFARDGLRLFATENVFDPALRDDYTPRDSVIGVYDTVAGYTRVAEIPTHGVGAHEVGLLEDGALVVANGGVYTHPSRDHEALNLETMAPSLTYIDARTGGLLRRERLADPQLSIRHLALAADGLIAIGLQYFGDTRKRVPLVAWQRGRGQPLVPLTAPAEAWDALEHYVGSVAIHPGTGVIAATSSQGGRIAFWEANGRYVSAIGAPEVSGIAVAGDDFVATTWAGALYVIDAHDLSVRHERRVPDVRWDNHLRLLESVT